MKPVHQNQRQSSLHNHTKHPISYPWMTLLKDPSHSRQVFQQRSTVYLPPPSQPSKADDSALLGNFPMCVHGPQKLNYSLGKQLIMSERKLVQAFRTFFQKSVAPYVSQNDEVMREWNHLNKIIGGEPIDYSQIEFYLLLSNKGNSNLQAKGSHNSIPSSGKIPDNDSKFRYSDFNAVMEKNHFEKKGSFLAGNPNSAKKKNLLASLEGFQKQLLYNQERLEALSRKEGAAVGVGSGVGGVNTSANGISMRRY